MPTLADDSLHCEESHVADDSLSCEDSLYGPANPYREYCASCDRYYWCGTFKRHFARMRHKRLFLRKLRANTQWRSLPTEVEYLILSFFLPKTPRKRAPAGI